jgi:hypothetical protein
VAAVAGSVQAGQRAAPARPRLVLASLIGVAVVAAIVFLRFPGKDQEEELLASYHAEDSPG